MVATVCRKAVVPPVPNSGSATTALTSAQAALRGVATTRQRMAMPDFRTSGHATTAWTLARWMTPLLLSPSPRSGMTTFRRRTYGRMRCLTMVVPMRNQATMSVTLMVLRMRHLMLR